MTMIDAALVPLLPTVTGLPTDLGALSLSIHGDNLRAGWWKKDDVTGRTLNRNIGELLALVHSEISEADEGYTYGLMDDKLPARRMVEVELADTAIRVLDLLGFYRDGKIGGLPNYADLRFPLDGSWYEWCRLMHRTTTAALEGFRKSNVEVGCARLIDLLGIIHFTALSLELDLTGAIEEKRAFNAHRADHKPENRAAAGGKQF